MRQSVIAVAAATTLAALLLSWPGAVRAEDAPPKEASKVQAREALAAFAKAYKAKDGQARLKAVETLGRVMHPKVAAKLVKLAAKPPTPELGAALYRALALQTTSAADVGPAVAKLLVTEAAARRKAWARGELGFPLDPKTGDPALDTPEGERVLAEGKARAAMWTAAVHCLHAHGHQSPPDAAAIAVLLQDPHDDLVVGVMILLAAWKAWSALPAMHELFLMYPAESLWETGAVNQPGGTDASAKRAWLARFGHPGKQRARPRVVKELLRALPAITGRAFETVEELTAFLALEDTRKQIAAYGKTKRRRR